MHTRLRALGERIEPASGALLGARLALVLDGMFTSAVHLGPGGPAAAAPGLVEELLEAARG